MNQNATETSALKPPIPLDERPIAEMPFEGGEETRALLTRCSVSKAFEIEGLGCTGAAGCGLDIVEITDLRLGLGGGGVGLPCFVPPNLFCLAHNTVGGLQREQEQRHPGNVAAISRELTRQEAGQLAFTEAVRHTGKGGAGEQMAAAQGAFSGFGDMPRGVEMVEESASEGGLPDVLAQGLTGARAAIHPFTCFEHPKTNWSCRFCVAQAIVEGELDTTFVVHQPDEEESDGVPIAGEAHFGLSGPELMAEVERRDAAGAKEIEVYVLAATYKRKLSR